jgi:hypothetical protein
MNTHRSRGTLLRKWMLVAVGLPVLVALWWAFRPEKLWINQKVNEPAPFDASADPRPILTGRFDGTARQTSGRATIYKKPGGKEYLHLSDFTTPSNSDVHVVLARSGDGNVAQHDLKSDVDLGPLKSSQGDQDYDLPEATDLNQQETVLIYCERDHKMSGFAKLEPF